jgi:hypothetical protein
MISGRAAYDFDHYTRPRFRDLWRMIKDNAENDMY